mmetsp:Transcript_32541/g.82097  ORF Transcript_32541/g.82097 Transcript_32541/m.82097 type:complete len:234 (-) Transcript_32541:2143-2844(-)
MGALVHETRRRFGRDLLSKAPGTGLEKVGDSEPQWQHLLELGAVAQHAYQPGSLHPTCDSDVDTGGGELQDGPGYPLMRHRLGVVLGLLDAQEAAANERGGCHETGPRPELLDRRYKPLSQYGVEHNLDDKHTQHRAQRALGQQATGRGVWRNADRPGVDRIGTPVQVAQRQGGGLHALRPQQQRLLPDGNLARGGDDQVAADQEDKASHGVVRGANFHVAVQRTANCGPHQP